MNHRWRAMLGIVVFASFLLTACASDPTRGPIEKDGRLYGVTEGAFRHRWWNYYERALSFADGGFYEHAILDLNQAISQRAADQRRARTYGMHFIDYFPHRELGVIYFHQGRHAMALDTLMASLDMVKTAKTEIYINRARKKIVEASGRDQQQPSLTMHTDIELTDKQVITLRGTAADDTFVTAITVGHTAVSIPLAGKQIDFEVDVTLTPGANVVPIHIEDIAGKTASYEFQAQYDPVGPLIQIDTVAPKSTAAGGQALFRLKGSVSDTHGVARIQIQDQTIDGHGESLVEFDVMLPVSTDSAVQAFDLAGNQTTARLGQQPVAAWTLPDTDDRQAPQIMVRDADNWSITFLSHVFLEGVVSDASTIRWLSINGDRMSQNRGGKLYFSRIVDLQPGENIISIQAEDGAGNRADKKLTVQREHVPVRDIGSRLRVAVNNFERKIIGRDDGLSFGFEDLVTAALLDRGRFNVLDRRRLKAVLEELKLSKSGLVDDDAAIEVGKLLAADCILLGSVLERKDSIESFVRLVDIETAEILAAADVYGEQIDVNALRTLGKGVDVKLTTQLPVAEGMIIDRKGDRIAIDLGKNRRLKKGMKLIVYRLGDVLRHPIDDTVMGLDFEILGQGRIDAVMEKMSFAILNDDADMAVIQPLRLVITR